MKTIFLILIIFSMKIFSQSNLFLITPEFGGSTGSCKEVKLYADTTDISFFIEYYAEREDKGGMNWNPYYDRIYVEDGYFSFSSNKFDIFNIEGDFVTFDDLTDNYKYLKEKFEELEKKYGEYTIEWTGGLFGKEQIKTQHFRIHIDKLVNCKEVEASFSEIDLFRCAFRCYPSFELTNSIEQIKSLVDLKENNIRFHVQVENIRVVDLLGKNIELQYSENIDISYLESNFYILQFTYNNQIYNHKFIK